jgi:hypothetical protein
MTLGNMRELGLNSLAAPARGANASAMFAALTSSR